VLVAVSVGITVQILTSANPFGLVTMYATYLGVVAPVVSLLAYLISWWWKGRRATAVVASAVQLTAAADQLAQRMLESWRREARGRRISTPAPVRVWGRWGAGGGSPPPGEGGTG